MKKINLSISGFMGRMGQQLIKSSKKNKKFKLVSLTENKLVNKKFSGLKPSINSINAFKKANVIIDFTVPKCTLEILRIASRLKKKPHKFNAQWRKVKQMQPMRLGFLSCRRFEDAFKSAQWIKVKQIQPMRLCFLSCK